MTASIDRGTRDIGSGLAMILYEILLCVGRTTWAANAHCSYCSLIVFTNLRI